MTQRVYLAGPDVFLREAAARGEVLRRLCAAAGLAAIFPLDPLPDEPAAWAALPPACRIARRNEAQIRRAGAVIANLTPFRGPSADAGTLYEIGYAAALGLPVLAWSNTSRDYLARCRDLPGSRLEAGVWRDAEGLEIEAFALPDNLMPACATLAMEREEVAAERRWEELAAFRRCVGRAASLLSGGS